MMKSVAKKPLKVCLITSFTLTVMFLLATQTFAGHQVTRVNLLNKTVPVMMQLAKGQAYVPPQKHHEC